VIASRLVPDWSEVHRATLENGWTNLLSLADHAWNGSDDLNRETNARLRRRWQINANRFFDETISSGLTALSKMIPSDPYPRVVVFNHLGWKRTALVRLVNPSPITDHLIDQESGAAIPAQIVVEGGQKVLYFIASEVPPTDYRVYILPTPVIPSPVADNPPANSNNRLETPFYMLEVSPRTGGIRRLFDKVRQKELVDPSSPYHLNQSLYLSSGEESTPLSAMIHPGPQGPCFCQLVVYTLLKGLQVKTTLTLYEALDRLDILNEVDKPVSVEKQELDFVFPFKVPHRQVRMEIPGAIITPGAEQRPGSGQAVNVIRRFVDVFNADYGITLSLADSAAVEFGHRTTSEDPHQPDDHNSTIFCLALENMVDYPESIHDQGGVTHFTFRYSLCGHSGGFDPVAALHFAWEDNNELLTCKLPALQQGDLPGGAFRFFTIDPPNIILTGCKIADQEGIILRLWECSGQDTTAVIQVAGLGTLIAARKTDLLETDLAELPVSENRLEVPVKARGFTAVRLLFN
jgi:alpha-mannosidase